MELFPTTQLHVAGEPSTAAHVHRTVLPVDAFRNHRGLVVAAIVAEAVLLVRVVAYASYTASIWCCTLTNGCEVVLLHSLGGMNMLSTRTTEVALTLPADTQLLLSLSHSSHTQHPSPLLHWLAIQQPSTVSCRSCTPSCQSYAHTHHTHLCSLLLVQSSGACLPGVTIPTPACLFCSHCGATVGTLAPSFFISASCCFLPSTTHHQAHKSAKHRTAAAQATHRSFGGMNYTRTPACTYHPPELISTLEHFELLQLPLTAIPPNARPESGPLASRAACGSPASP